MLPPKTPFLTNALESFVVASFVVAIMVGILYAFANYKVNILPITKQTDKSNPKKVLFLRSENATDKFEQVPVDCEVSNDMWNSWSNCSKTCGGGTRTRNKVITQLAKFGGKECPDQKTLTETVGCNKQLC